MLDVPLFSFPFSLVTRMVLALLKWFKETGFYKKKKKKIKTWALHSTQELVERRSLHDVLRNESYITVLKNKQTNKQTKKQKKNDRIFFLAWNIVYWLLKNHCFEFLGDGKYSLFWAKKLMEKWHLLITEKFLFWTFREWEIRSFFETKS